MTAYKLTLRINAHSPEQYLLQAAELLDRCGGEVIFEGIATLRPTLVEIICEVSDPIPGAHRCAEEFKVILENAQRAFSKSRLADLLPHRPLQWLVMDSHDTRTKLWPVP